MKRVLLYLLLFSFLFLFSGCTLSLNISDLNAAKSSPSLTEDTLSKIEQINITNNTINEHQSIGSFIGELSALSNVGGFVDVSFSLTDGLAYPDNNSFEIIGNQLTQKLFFIMRLKMFILLKSKHKIQSLLQLKRYLILQ